MDRRLLVPTLALGALEALFATSTNRASAATFDGDTGKLTFDSATSEGFESGIDSVRATGPDRSPVDAKSRNVSDPASLEGEKVLLVGGAVYRVNVDLATLSGKLAGRRVEVRVWEQPRGTQLAAYVTWSSGVALAAGIRMTPTGRGTDDGWRELSSGPIDFTLGGKIAPQLLLSDVQLVGSASDPYAFNGGDPSIVLDEDARVAVDAIEITDLGEAATPAATCTGGDEVTACGAHGLCLYGRCVDAAAVAGAIPAAKPIRHGFLDRARFFYETLEAGMSSREHLPDVVAALTAIRDSDDPRAFWPALSKIELLHDGHAYPFRGGSVARVASGVCLGLGDADLLPGAPTAVPMVFAADAATAGGALVKTGDVLVAIDGAPVADWIAAHRRSFYVPGDPATAPLVDVASIMSVATASGSKLRFSRWTSTGIVDVAVDLAALAGAKLWSDAGITADDLKPMDCDPRFSRAFSGHESYGYTFADSKDVDPSTRLVFFNGVPAESYEGGLAYKTKMTTAMSVVRPRLILDERVGGGGWFEPTFSIVFGSIFDKADRARAEMIPGLEGAPIDPTLTDLRTCLADTGSGYQCGFYESWSFDAGAASANNAVSRVAVLMGQDVSGNDFFTRIVKMRTGPTRLFGPVPAYGAYGRIQFLPGMGIALGAASIQIQDSIFVVDDADPSRPFESSTGVKPDVVVRQKQSDALAGKDTAYEAALAWVSGS
jgi:hypothetical protein